MLTNENKVTLIKTFCYTAIVIASLIVLAFYIYLELSVKKIPEHYKHASLTMCMKEINRNSIFVLDEEQIKRCSNMVNEVYHEKPQSR